MFKYPFTYLTIEDYDSDTIAPDQEKKVVVYDADPWINKLMEMYYTGKFC